MTRLTKPVRRVGATPLGNGFGPDRNRRITITLIPGNGDDVPDAIELRPLRRSDWQQNAKPEPKSGWCVTCDFLPTLGYAYS